MELLSGLNGFDFPQQAWETYINQRRLLPGVSPAIAQSWERCRLVLDPLHQRHLQRLSADHLLSTQVANFELLSIARPVVEDIYQYTENSGIALLVVNAAGYIMDAVGDADILATLFAYQLTPGAVMAESHMGTNAFALCLQERIPMQVIGQQHYLRQFHNLAEAAAPIFDPTGNPLGAIGIVTEKTRYHPHSLGLVVAGARAIEGQRQSDLLLGERNNQLSGLNAILSAISEGILVWSAERVIIHANAAAIEILNSRRDLLLGRTLHEAIVFPDAVLYAILNYEPLTNVEASLQIQDQQIQTMLSLRFVRGSRGVEESILVMRRAQEVRQMVHQQMGAHVSFSIEELVGKTPDIRRVRHLATNAAAARASVLIYGESGTGKNLLARAIHNLSPQRFGPFIVFACTSIPGELTLPELLGVDESYARQHSAGRPGKCELADGGTLYIKDIESLSLEGQSVILNMLELGIIQRLGSRRPIEVNVRVVASTCDNLEQRLRQGVFLPELYYRLTPFQLQLPPIRKRMDDLPLLADNILERLRRYNNRQVSLAPETYPALKRYAWPGNVRELEAVLEQASIHCEAGGVIRPENLPAHVLTPDSQHTMTLPIGSLQQIEQHAIRQAARVCRGNLTQMARMLGIGRTTLWRRLKQMDINLAEYHLP